MWGERVALDVTKASRCNVGVNYPRVTCLCTLVDMSL